MPITGPHGRTATTAEVQAMMGLNPKRHLPELGTSEVEVQGYRVWVRTAHVARVQSSARKPHRVVAACKDCGYVIPVGRLAQHEGSKACQSRQA